MHILYLNVYAVTRHYGGPEEGSWFFNMGQPLASVPIPAEEKPGCSEHCSNCLRALAGEKDNEGNPIELCKAIPPDHDEYVNQSLDEAMRNRSLDEYWRAKVAAGEILKPHLMDIYGPEAKFPHHKFDRFPGLSKEEIREAIEEEMIANYPKATHLVPIRNPIVVVGPRFTEDSFEDKKKELEEMFADEEHGNIYSVLGGQAVEVQLEEHFAEAWPKKRPHFE